MPIERALSHPLLLLAVHTMAFTMQSANRVAPVATRRGAAPRRAAAFRTVTSASARVDKCDKKKIVVSPSILSANFSKLGEQARGRAGRLRRAARGARARPSAPARRAQVHETLALSLCRLTHARRAAPLATR